ncbi:2,3-bisphosphoglycerate-independent phosphoglycerate mutase [Aequitasia blattaphilus]|uniref:Cofactor-independent phosphoglycerate mutase n=1 Tax=Aequitasia blattaphilus TaxID=2949332 RepID=A0ABT1EAA4_9FIRM|nr:cofactor-independent phosphoglycerate mutase [Aequitasia blattaphilus]MCP1101437.1 cofactor-independent phosphoglycerate mutase [Aequitasia blattaphilus]MCR8614077.1 cofactor-independent phosphoglycerate mutase [Aequitasia blattaphilus]
MKYIVLLSDGMAGEPIEELGNKTTMEAAHKPNMDRLCKVSQVGMARTVPEGMAPGSDTANLAVLGYNPRKYYTGRSPLEALSIGAKLEDADVSLRMNFVTLRGEGPYEKKIILDHSAGEISTQDAEVLLKAVIDNLKRDGYEFYLGTSYRHLLVIKNGEVVELMPPHDILSKEIGNYLPKDEILREMMVKSNEILEGHPLNQKRKEEGKNPANSIWFWGAGTRPALSSFEEEYKRKGVMISAVDLLKGIATGASMKVIEVEGANGGLHTNYEGKAKAAFGALVDEGYDFAYIHVEAPDEMGHQGLIKEKIEAIENIDGKVLKPLVELLDCEKVDYKIMILPDHPTPTHLRTHTSNPVPFMIYDSTKEEKGVEGFNEKMAKDTGIFFDEGYQLMGHFLDK